MLRSAFRLGCNSRIGINLIITRSYSGRRPVRIINDEEENPPIESFREETRPGRKKSKLSDVYRQSNIDGQFYIKSQINKDVKELDIELDSHGKAKPPWKEETDDFRLSKFMVTVKSRSKRRKEKITLLEGKRLICDALLAGVKLKALFTSQRTAIQSLPLPTYRYQLCWIPYKYFTKWADVTTSSGILAIVEIPSTKETAPDPNSLPLTVICDNIRDPGNMGAILRVLAAVGCQKILVTKGCVDIWEPKVLRAAAGGHFRVPIEYDVNWEYINSLIEEETASVFLADSGNVSHKDKADTGDPNSEENESTDSNGENTDLDGEDTTETRKSTIHDSEALETLPYYNLQFKTSGQNVLVISNESFGPTDEAHTFTCDRKGVKIHIPLCGNVESLNVVSALSVITFEMRRQMSVSS